MVKDYETKLLKLNAPLRGMQAGTELKVKTRNGVLLDQYWRRRMKDAEIDNCVEMVKRELPRKEKKKEE